MNPYGLVAGTEAYKYQLVQQIGSGQNQVWLALDRATGRQVALKFLDISLAPVGQCLWEAHVGARFRHPNLCEVVGADSANINGTDFFLIAHQYFQKGNCANNYAGPGVIPPKTVQKLLLHVLSGLEHLHIQNFLHNDIKPGNILVGDHDDYLLTDYGIVWSPNFPNIARQFYIPHVAPESIIAGQGHVPSVQTDVYQLGVTAYRLLNGLDRIRDEFSRLGPDAFKAEVAAGRIPDRDSFEPWIPTPFASVIRKAIALDPAERYQSAMEMRRDLEALNMRSEWAYGANQELVGDAANNTYRIEVSAHKKGGWIVRCLRLNKISNRETEVKELRSFAKTDLQVKRAKARIFRWVLKEG